MKYVILSMLVNLNVSIFVRIFLKPFKKNISTESAEVIESTEKAILYCKQCMKKDI